MFFVLGSINTITNIACCVIMIRFVSLVKRITHQTKLAYEKDNNSILKDKLTVNTLLANLHVSMIFAYSIVMFFELILYPFM